MKICIYSGTFNPVHQAHIKVIEGILEEFDYDKIIIIPNNIPPHKNAEDIASAQDRLEMLRLAFDNPKIEISDIEISRGGKSYSYDTVRAIKEQYGIEDKISFLIGTDALMGLRSWYNFEEFTKEVDFLVVQRQNDYNVMQILLNLNIEGLTCIFAKVPYIDISSSEIRTLVKQGENVHHLTHQNVNEYIKEQKLYQTYTFDEIIEILKKEFNSHIEHSVAVAEFGANLAWMYETDSTKARIAGILHDCVKYLGKEKIVEMVKEYNVEVFDHEMNAPRTLHGPLGAYIAKTRFRIEDEDILNAIRFHTIGRENMSLLEKIIFISDKIEPVTREEEFRALIDPELKKGLDFAISKYYELLIEKLQSENVKVSDYTLDVAKHFQAATAR
jgi:nicotinate-nucleotide adenylyltransferase